MSTHRFEVLVDGELKVFTEFGDVPGEFENLITFIPHVPDEERDFNDLEYVEGLQTAEICHVWHQRFKELKSRETR